MYEKWDLITDGVSKLRFIRWRITENLLYATLQHRLLSRREVRNFLCLFRSQASSALHVLHVRGSQCLAMTVVLSSLRTCRLSVGADRSLSAGRMNRITKIAPKNPSEACLESNIARTSSTQKRKREFKFFVNCFIFEANSHTLGHLWLLFSIVS